MSDGTFGDLVVRVGANTTDFVKGMTKSRSQLRQLGREAELQTKKLGKFAAGALAAGAVLSSALVANSIKSSRELANLARQADATANNLTKQAYATQSAGVPLDKYADILRDVKDRVGDFIATGAGPMADFFENIAPKVGVTAEQFRKLSGPEALQLYVSSLEKAGLSQAELTFYMEAMSSDATALLPLLRDNGKAMKEGADQADRLGIALSDVDAANMEDAAKVFDQVSGVLGGYIDQLSADLSPVISAVGKQFLGLAEDAGGVDDAAGQSFNAIIEGAGFVMDAVEGIKRTFEIAGKSIAVVFGLGLKEMGLYIADFLVNRPVQAANELIAMLNNTFGTGLEPINLSGFGDSIRSEIELTQNAMTEGWADIQAVLNEPLPSHQFKQFVVEAQQAAESAAAALQSATGKGGEEVGGGSGQMPKDLQQRLEAVRQANASELQLLQEKHEQELADIAAAQQLKTENAAQYDALYRQTVARQNEEVNAIEKQAADAREAMTQAEADARYSAMMGALSSLSTLMNGESKKMFKIGKIAAISGAVISTIDSAQRSYEALAGIPVVGPGLGIAAAGAATLAGFARVKQIKARQFNESASVPSASSSGGKVSTAVSGATDRAASQNHYYHGINPGSLYTGDQMLDAVNTAIKNGGRIVDA